MLMALFGASVASAAPKREVVQRSEHQLELMKLMLLANTEFTLFHEFGHLVIAEFDPPVLGYEEDAADRFAAVSMILKHQLNHDEENIIWMLLVAAEWISEWRYKERNNEVLAYWDAHSLEIQRYHNILCLVSGSNPDIFNTIGHTEELPDERSWSCPAEFSQARKALQWLYANYGKQSSEAAQHLYGHVTVNYEVATTDSARFYQSLLRESRIAEEAGQYIAAQYKFPRDITLTFQHCAPDAYANTTQSPEIVMCYELFDRFVAVIDAALENGTEEACAAPYFSRYLGKELGCDGLNENPQVPAPSLP